MVEAGQPFVVEDSDGNVVERNSGSVGVTFLFANGGDDEPGGTYLDVIDVRVAGPHPSLEKHPCDYASRADRLTLIQAPPPRLRAAVPGSSREQGCR